jgi:hypothetical protein
MCDILVCPESVEHRLRGVRAAIPDLWLDDDDQSTPADAAAIPAIAAAIEPWLAAEAEMHSGLDRRAQAAFVIGKAARSISHPLAAIFMLHGATPELVADRVHLRRQRYRWEHDGESGEALRYVPCFNSRAFIAGDVDALRAAIDAALIAAMTPLVSAARSASGLSPGALWRLVADMVCSAFLNVGEQIGDIPGAQVHALSVARRPGSPLNNRVSGFQHVTLPDPADPARILAERWFITRGGCCRWYTHPEGEYCATCVLLKPEQQQAKLRDHLRRQREAAA